jgi:hypothetical protein
MCHVKSCYILRFCLYNIWGMGIWVCMCVCERDTETETYRQIETQRDRDEGEHVCFSSGCYNKIPQTVKTGWVKWQTFISHNFERLGSPKSKHWQIWCLVRSSFRVHRQASFHCAPRVERGGRKISEHSYRGTKPVHEGSTLMTSSKSWLPPKDPLPNIKTLVGRVSTY